jgi:hypothetical protein
MLTISCEVKELEKDENSCKLEGGIQTHYNVCPDRQSGLRISKLLNVENSFAIVNFERYDINLSDYSIEHEITLTSHKEGMQLMGTVEAGKARGFFNFKPFDEILKNARGRKLFLVDNTGTVVDEYRMP